MKGTISIVGRRANKLTSGLFLVLMVVFAISPVYTARGELSPEFLDDINIIYQQKAKCEEAVRDLKATSKNEDNAKLREGKKLYDNAQIAFNAWIKEIVLTLKSGQKIKPFQEAKAKNAVVESQKFIAFVDQLTGASKGIGADVLGKIIEGVTGAGLKIWEAYRNSSKEKQTEIINEIQTLKWQPFAQIR